MPDEALSKAQASLDSAREYLQATIEALAKIVVFKIPGTNQLDRGVRFNLRTCLNDLLHLQQNISEEGDNDDED